jgi:hypothetical protein
MKRYIARYSGKDGFEERYEVIDTNTGESISGQLPYHTANDKARMLNQEPDPSAFGLAPVAMVAPTIHADLAAELLKQWQSGNTLLQIPIGQDQDFQFTPIFIVNEPDNG